MGQQMNFIIDEETEKDFFHYLTGGNVILFEGENIKPIEIHKLPEAFSGKGWFKVYIYNDSLGKYHLEDLSNGRKIINAMTSPVIEFSRTTIREKDITRGRLWVETKYYDEDHVVQKPIELKDLYKDCCKWIRSRTKRIDLEINGLHSKEYVSPKIEQILRKGYKVY